MRRRAAITTSLLWALVAATPARDAFGDRDGSSPSILGRWATAGFGSIVELHPCETASTAGTVCGRIAWLWDALEADGRLRLDRENPQASARALPLVGAEILQGFRETSPGVWSGGSVYNPEDGRTYSGTIRWQRDGTLELEGCAFRIFCQRQTWRRPKDLLEQAAEQ